MDRGEHPARRPVGRRRRQREPVRRDAHQPLPDRRHRAPGDARATSAASTCSSSTRRSASTRGRWARSRSKGRKFGLALALASQSLGGLGERLREHRPHERRLPRAPRPRVPTTLRGLARLVAPVSVDELSSMRRFEVLLRMPGPDGRPGVYGGTVNPPGPSDDARHRGGDHRAQRRARRPPARRRRGRGRPPVGPDPRARDAGPGRGRGGGQGSPHVTAVRPGGHARRHAHRHSHRHAFGRRPDAWVPRTNRRFAPRDNIDPQLPRGGGRAPARSRPASHPRPRGPAHPQPRPTRQRRAARHPRVPQPPATRRSDSAGCGTSATSSAPACHRPRASAAHRYVYRLAPAAIARLGYAPTPMARTRLHRPHARRGRGRLRAGPLDRSRHAAHRPALAARVDRRRRPASGPRRRRRRRHRGRRRPGHRVPRDRRGQPAPRPDQRQAPRLPATHSTGVRAGTSCSSCRPPTAPPGSAGPREVRSATCSAWVTTLDELRGRGLGARLAPVPGPSATPMVLGASVPGHRRSPDRRSDRGAGWSSWAPVEPRRRPDSGPSRPGSGADPVPRASSVADERRPGALRDPTGHRPRHAASPSRRGQDLLSPRPQRVHVGSTGGTRAAGAGRTRSHRERPPAGRPSRYSSKVDEVAPVVVQRPRAPRERGASGRLIRQREQPDPWPSGDPADTSAGAAYSIEHGSGAVGWLACELDVPQS